MQGGPPGAPSSTPAPQQQSAAQPYDIQMREDHIVHARIRAGIHFDRRLASEIIEATKVAIGARRRAPILLEFEGYANGDAEARHLLASSSIGEATLAGAMLVPSPVMRVVATFYIRVNRPEFPCRVFVQEGEALEWLRGYL